MKPPWAAFFINTNRQKIGAAKTILLNKKLFCTAKLAISTSHRKVEIDGS
jgi:hypothetical protein